MFVLQNFSICVCVHTVCHWNSLLVSGGGVSVEWAMRFGVTAGETVWIVGMNNEGMESVWRMGAGAWGPIPSTEAIVRSEYWREKVGVEDEFAREGERVRRRYGDCILITNSDQLGEEWCLETEDWEGLKQDITHKSLTDLHTWCKGKLKVLEFPITVCPRSHEVCD